MGAHMCAGILPLKGDGVCEGDHPEIKPAHEIILNLEVTWDRKF